MERVLTQKVNWLADNTPHEITILTTEPVPAGTPKCYFPLSEKVQVAELNIDFNADYTKPLLPKYYAHMRRMRMYKRALTEYIVQHGIDLCISLGGKEIAILRHLPCRTIAEMHFAMNQRRQLIEANHKSLFWSLAGEVRTKQLVQAVKSLERLVVLTDADKAAWEKAGCTNVTVIPNPCAINSRKSKVESRKTKTVLAVGRLHEQKGFDLLLQAWQPIEKHYPEWQLRIVGEGPKRAELETQVRELTLRHAIIAGRTENVADEYSSASLFVLSSRYEGFSLVLAEAMWCGTPCVAFDCPQGPAELLADGRGWLVENGNVEKLTQQIIYAISHPEEAAAHAQKAQAFAQATYSEAAIMPLWIRIIEQHE
jgi:glycosyltransferase involved in cell wall biosynthesis